MLKTVFKKTVEENKKGKLSFREVERNCIEETLLRKKQYSSSEIELQQCYLEYLKSIIDLKVDNWSNIDESNCLAFALGLDFSNSEWNQIQKPLSFAMYQNLVRYDIYGCGGIYLNLSESPKNISNLKRVERLELDLYTLGILYEQIDIKDKVTSPDEWKIAFFEADTKHRLFHVFREYENGIWYHKPGYSKVPTNLDFNQKIITNPIESMKKAPQLYIRRQEYQKTYRLRQSK